MLAYASRVLTKPERNYDVIKRELLAVIYGLITYRQYLLDRHFVISTDHSALQSLRKTPEPIGQQARWQTFIEEFQFTIIHRPGTQHSNADALSRRPTSEKESEETTCHATTIKEVEPTHESNKTEATFKEEMSELQAKDIEIGPIFQWRKRQTMQPRPEEIVAESEVTKVLWNQWHVLTIRNGVLYRLHEFKHGQPATLQLIMPYDQRNDFIRQCHIGMTGGHRAYQATADQVQRRAYWPGWRQDVKRQCAQCMECMTYHRGKLPKTGPLQPMVTGSTMERCHIDITGPHPTTV